MSAGSTITSVITTTGVTSFRVVSRRIGWSVRTGGPALMGLMPGPRCARGIRTVAYGHEGIVPFAACPQAPQRALG